MAKWAINDSTLVGIADAVRAKRGTVAPIQVSNLADEIELIDSKLLRDSIVIPDKYNTGCHGQLTKFDKTQDTSGLVWRDSLTLDFNNSATFQNLVDDQVIVFENYDFTGLGEFYFLNVQSYTTDKAYYKDNLKFVFKNCLFEWVRQDYGFDSNVDISIEFYDCSFNRIKVGNAIIDRCLVGNVTYYQSLLTSFTPSGDTINPVGPMTVKNTYVMDVEASTETSGEAHIDGFQTIVENGHDMHLYNCRFECFDMPYAHSQGNWSYDVFWQVTPSNSSMEYCVIHGGGYYGLSMGKGTNQTVQNNLVSGEYHCAEGAPESDWVRICYPNENCYQMSDGIGDYIRTLLVSSVWVENGKIKICYSNDMHSTRTMRIVTDGGVTTTVTVPACPIRDTAATEGVTQWSDLPFDLVAQIDAAGVHSINIYDGNTLVRTYTVETADSRDNVGTKSITANGTYTAQSDNLDGYSSVTVNVPSSVSGTLNITQNGVYDVSQYASADVSVSGGGTPSYLSIQNITPASDSNSIEVPYDTTKSLIGVFCYDTNRSNNNTYTMTGIAWYKYRGSDTGTYKVGYLLNYQGNEAGNISFGAVTVDDVNGIITLAAHDTRYYFRSNRAYRVIIIYDETV